MIRAVFGVASLPTAEEFCAGTKGWYPVVIFRRLSSSLPDYAAENSVGRCYNPS